jgi:hypothetical protein
MSITNKKTDTLRRLFLGPLYGECKDNPMGVSRKQLQERLDKLVDDGCVLDCSVDEMVKTCQLKSHYPLCAKDRKCIEETWPKQRGIDKLSYQQYNTSKMFENEPDTDDEEEEEECNICMMDEDENGNPIKEMSCGHKSHISCLIKVAQQKGRDNAECPECRKEFSLREVPVPERTLQQRQSDSQRRADFNASQMGVYVPTAEERENEELRRDNEERRRMEELNRRYEERQALIREEMRRRGIQEPQRPVENLSEEFRNIGRQINDVFNSRLVLREREKEQIYQLINRLEAIASTPDEIRKIEQIKQNMRDL